MAVGSGFAYYSLSSILITQFKEPSIGLQLATELGTIALLTNIFREMMALLGTPIIKKYFGKLAPISAANRYLKRFSDLYQCSCFRFIFL